MLKYERYSYNVLIIAVYYKNLQWRRCAQESGGGDLWEKKSICHGSMSLHLLAYWTFFAFILQMQIFLNFSWTICNVWGWGAQHLVEHPHF
jgi:hypothetical protein